MRLFGFDIRRAGDVTNVAPGVDVPEAVVAEERSSLENPKVSLDDPAALSMLGLGDAAGSGAVTPNSALGVSAVYACVFYIAKALAWLPIHILQKVDGSTVVIIGNSVADMLGMKPNSYQTPFIFKLMMWAQALLWGNAYAEIQRDIRTGEVLGLYPIPSWEVTVKLEKGVKTFLHRGQVFSNDEIFHLMAPTIDGARGMSPIRLHKLTVGMAQEALAYGEQFYRNGTRLAGALEHPQRLSNEAAARLRQNWTATYAGKANAGKVAVLEEGMKFNPFTMPMEDAQYVETRKFSVSEIARIYGVPPHKIGDLDKATFSNIEHQSIEAVNDCLMPYIVQFEEEAKLKLLTPRQVEQGYSAKYNVKALFRSDVKAQMEAIKIGRDIGVYSVDDACELLDRNPVGGEGGAERIRPMNMVPIGTPASAAKENQPAPAPAA